MSNNILNLTDNSIYAYKKYISQYKVLTEKEEYGLMTQYFTDRNQEAGKAIILSHLKLVVKIAYQYKNYGFDLLDLVAEGNVGLLHALKKFDIKKNVRFSTYAMLWIKAFIQDFIIKSWSFVRTGSELIKKNLIFNFKNLKNKLGIAENENFDVQNEKLATYFNTTAKEIGNVRNDINKNNYLSIESNHFVSDDDNNASNTNFVDSLISYNDVNYLSELENNEISNSKTELVKNAIEKLDDREKFIIHARYLSEKKITLDDLAKKFDLSKERIRQIEVQIINKIKNYVKFKKLI